MNYFFDVRESVARIRLENTHLEENELWDLRRSLETIGIIVTFLNRNDQSDERGKKEDEATIDYQYPALHRMAENVQTFPAMIRRIDSILDKFGRIKDSASMVLAGIRHDMEQTAGSISRTLYTILHAAQREGLVAQDVAPTLRDGRLMIPVAPGLKRKINGIVHDESATGKTVFIEPAEVVEANNKVRELEAARGTGLLPIPSPDRLSTCESRDGRADASLRTTGNSRTPHGLDSSHTPATETLAGKEGREGRAAGYYIDSLPQPLQKEGRTERRAPLLFGRGWG